MMSPSMNVLLAQETLSIAPASGVFDVDAVAKTIAGLGFSFRDEADPSRFVISSDAKPRETFAARRRADPSSPFPYVLLVTVTPGEMIVSPVADHPGLRALSEKFLTWVTSTYQCKIDNEFGTDVATLPEPAVTTPQVQRPG